MASWGSSECWVGGLTAGFSEAYKDGMGLIDEGIPNPFSQDMMAAVSPLSDSEDSEDWTEEGRLEARRIQEAKLRQDYGETGLDIFTVEVTPLLWILLKHNPHAILGGTELSPSRISIERPYAYPYIILSDPPSETQP